MTNKDIKIVITFEDDMRPTVNMGVTFSTPDEMGTYLNKLKEFWESHLQDEITAQEILDKMKEKK